MQQMKQLEALSAPGWCFLKIIYLCNFLAPNICLNEYNYQVVTQISSSLFDLKDMCQLFSRSSTYSNLWVKAD